MSSNTSIYYGWGFEVDGIKPLNIIAFMENHQIALCQSNREKEMLNAIHNTEDGIFAYNFANDFFEEWSCECDVSYQIGLGAVVSNIISRETGISVEFQMGQSDCCSVPSVLFTERMPWHLNEKEKDLTLESLTELLLPYVIELGLKETDIQALSIEYFG